MEKYAFSSFLQINVIFTNVNLIPTIAYSTMSSLHMNDYKCSFSTIIKSSLITNTVNQDIVHQTENTCMKRYQYHHLCYMSEYIY